MLAGNEIEDFLVEAFVIPVLVNGKTALDEGHDQGQEIVAQARALDDQRGQRQVGRGTDHQGVTLERGIGEQVVEVGLEAVEVGVCQLVAFG